MLVIPSIDIHRGKCVKWVRGQPGTGKVIGDPVEVAMKWIHEGATWLHVVDLDAARGEGDNFNRVVEILASVGGLARVQVGGGIRTKERAFELLGVGADRVILGTLATENAELLREIVEKAGKERVMVALDSSRGRVVRRGWKEKTEFSPLELARGFERLGVGILYTEVDTEGTQAGLRSKLASELIRSVRVPVFLAGGIATLEDIRRARDWGAAGVILGMALYEGRFTLREAQEVAG